MANATATITVDTGGPTAYRVFMDNNAMEVFGIIAITANPATYPAGGVPIAWNVPGIQTANLTPYHVEFMSVATAPGLFTYTWDSANGKFHILTASGGAAQSAPYVELTAASAIPAGVSGDTIRFHAVFLRS